MDNQTYQMIEKALEYTSTGFFWAGYAVLCWAIGGIVQDIVNARHGKSKLENSVRNPKIPLNRN